MHTVVYRVYLVTYLGFYIKLLLTVTFRKGRNVSTVHAKIGCFVSQLLLNYCTNRRIFDSCVLVHVHEIAPLNALVFK